MSRDMVISDGEVVHAPQGTFGAIVKSEVEAQLDAAHKYPRSIRRFMDEAVSIATETPEVAESCLFSIPRDGKIIAGPSVRLAEICASAYCNLQYGGRVVDEDDKYVTAQGVAWDMQKNTRVTIETRRRITGKTGKRFSDDMVAVTGNAARSIALRDAVFRVIPRALVDQVYAKVKLVAVGDAKSLATRRAQVLERLQKIGVPLDRVWPKLEIKGPEDIGLEELEVLIGLGAAIKSGEIGIDDAFPPAAPPAPPGAADEGKRISLRTPKKEPEAAASPPQEGT